MVDDASRFEIGEWVSVSSNGGYDVTTGWLVIQDIQGNRIRSIPPLEDPLTNLTLSSDSPLFYIRKPGVTIKNFVLDGNYENNDTIIKWDSSIMVIVSAENTTIKDGFVKEAPGDFLQFAIDADNSEVRNVEAHGGAGVFVHLTGIGLNGEQGVRIIDNKISDFGRDFLREDHSFGAIEWSDNVGSVVVKGNHFEDLPYAAINMRDDQLGTHVLIKDNTAIRTDGFIRIWNIEPDPDAIRQTILIEGNELRDTKLNMIRPLSDSEPFNKLTIVNNKGDNTYWDISGVEHLSFIDNEFIISDLESAGLGLRMDWDSTPGILSLRSVKDGKVEGNYFEGNWRQVVFENRGFSEDFAFESAYTFQENTFLDFLYSGLEGASNKNALGGINETVDWSSSDNVLKSTVLGLGTNLSPAGFGVIYSAGGSHSGNCVEINSPSDDTFAARVFGYQEEQSQGVGGSFTSNLFLNHQGRSIEWGVAEQRHSLLAISNTISDKWPSNLLDSTAPHLTLVDPSKTCQLINTRVLNQDLPDHESLGIIFPNPVRDIAFLELVVGENAYTNIDLYSLEGRKVLDVFEGLVLAGLTSRIRIDASALASGLYFLRSENKLGVASAKLTVLN